MADARRNPGQDVYSDGSNGKAEEVLVQKCHRPSYLPGCTSLPVLQMRDVNSRYSRQSVEKLFLMSLTGTHDQKNMNGVTTKTTFGNRKTGNLSKLVSFDHVTWHSSKTVLQGTLSVRQTYVDQFRPVYSRSWNLGGRPCQLLMSSVVGSTAQGSASRVSLTITVKGNEELIVK